MQALVITLPREHWPAAMTNHFHIVGPMLTNAMVGSIRANYRESTVTEYEWDEIRPTCAECGQELGGVARG